jgi:hypothetical protein
MTKICDFDHEIMHYLLEFGLKNVCTPAILARTVHSTVVDTKQVKLIGWWFTVSGF